MKKRQSGLYIPAIGRIRRKTVALFLAAYQEPIFGLRGEQGDPGEFREMGVHLLEDLDALPAEVTRFLVSGDDLDRVLKARGLHAVTIADVLAPIMKTQKTIAVTGTHGKGTVAAMLAWIMECAGLSPGFLIAGKVRNFDGYAKAGKGEWLVLEADEADGEHRHLNPDYLLCNFLEMDHLEYYRDFNDLLSQMRAALEENRRLKEAFINMDCLGNRRLVEALGLRPTGYALGHKAEFHATRIGEESDTVVEVFQRDRRLGEFRISISGSYNAINMLGAIAVATRLGIEQEVIADALARFTGVEDRYTVLRGAGVRVIKDRTMHPTGIEAVLKDEENTGARLVCLQASSLQRLEALKERYQRAFAHVDHVVLTGTREMDLGRQQEFARWVEELRSHDLPVRLVPGFDDAVDYLRRNSTPDDGVFFFGNEELLEQADRFVAGLVTDESVVEGRRDQPEMRGPLLEGGEDE